MSDIDLTQVVQESKSTLFILCGLPYAGKSYVAKEIQKLNNIVYVAIDDIFREHGFDWDSNNLPDADAWEQIFNESYEQTKKGLLEGKNVLYDSTNQTLASRDRLREVAKSVDAEAKVIYIKSSTETVWKRWEENQKNPSRSVVSKELVQMTVDTFEEPAEREDAIIIRN